MSGRSKKKVTLPQLRNSIKQRKKLEWRLWTRKTWSPIRT